MTEPTDRPNFFRLESAELVAFARRSQATIVPPYPHPPPPLSIRLLCSPLSTLARALSAHRCALSCSEWSWYDHQGRGQPWWWVLDFQLALAVNDSQPHLSPDHNLLKFDGVTNGTEGTRTGTFSNWQTHVPKQRVQLMVQGSTREVLAFGFHSISRDKTPYLTETLAMVQTFRTITS